MSHNSWRSHWKNKTKHYSHGFHGVHSDYSEPLSQDWTLIVDILIFIVCTGFETLFVDNIQVGEMLNVQYVWCIIPKQNNVPLMIRCFLLRSWSNIATAIEHNWSNMLQLFFVLSEVDTAVTFYYAVPLPTQEVVRCWFRFPSLYIAGNIG